MSDEKCKCWTEPGTAECPVCSNIDRTESSLAVRTGSALVLKAWEQAHEGWTIINGPWWHEESKRWRIVAGPCGGPMLMMEFACTVQGEPNVEVCDGGCRASELKQDANRHSQH